MILSSRFGNLVNYLTKLKYLTKFYCLCRLNENIFFEKRNFVKENVGSFRFLPLEKPPDVSIRE